MDVRLTLRDSGGEEYARCAGWGASRGHMSVEVRRSGHLRPAPSPGATLRARATERGFAAESASSPARMTRTSAAQPSAGRFVPRGHGCGIRHSAAPRDGGRTRTSAARPLCRHSAQGTVSRIGALAQKRGDVIRGREV